MINHQPSSTPFPHFSAWWLRNCHNMSQYFQVGFVFQWPGWPGPQSVDCPPSSDFHLIMAIQTTIPGWQPICNRNSTSCQRWVIRTFRLDLRLELNPHVKLSNWASRQFRPLPWISRWDAVGARTLLFCSPPSFWLLLHLHWTQAVKTWSPSSPSMVPKRPSLVTCTLQSFGSWVNQLCIGISVMPLSQKTWWLNDVYWFVSYCWHNLEISWKSWHIFTICVIFCSCSSTSHPSLGLGRKLSVSLVELSVSSWLRNIEARKVLYIMCIYVCVCCDILSWRKEFL